MKKSTKAWLITAGSLVLLGCIIFVCTMSVLKWDFQTSQQSNTKRILMM